MAHPTGKALEIAEEVEDALDGRINLDDLFRSLHIFPLRGVKLERSSSSSTQE
jgi:hypothetical protein